ncbi:hypothetical protein [Haloferax sp. Q22]|uniref:hypothetical protein n=1 Tax=Haloferax sp. (strain Q22) TaxID=1526048 RepID=UPI000737C633|nr:hypothetical protein [Haloferax sp. Q22]
MNEELYDDHDIPKAYTIIERLKKVEDDMNASTDKGESGAAPYFNITANIREELAVYLGINQAKVIQDLLLNKEFEQVYDLLDQHWETSVRNTVPAEELDNWTPDKDKPSN